MNGVAAAVRAARAARPHQIRESRGGALPAIGGGAGCMCGAGSPATPRWKAVCLSGSDPRRLCWSRPQMPNIPEQVELKVILGNTKWFKAFDPIIYITLQVCPRVSPPAYRRVGGRGDEE